MATLSALPVHPRSWAALLERDDIVLDQGVLRLRHDRTTPDDARTEDLLLAATALEAAGVSVLLVRHDVRIPALVVDVADAAAAVAALRELPEPLYVKRKAHGAILAAELDDPASSPAAIRVYRPRISESGELRYNHEIGTRVEFWRFGDELVEAPHDNALTRRLTPASDIDFTDVERYGRRWRTIAGMFDVHPAEFTEDVDMVFSWVDGSSTDFQRQRAAQMAEYVVGEGDDGPARYRHVDELRYALRSVHMYAPWVRRIFIATDSPAPAWLLDHPKVTIVRSEEFFADTSVLPIHNSHAVEAQLHRIDGLAEHFLYSNDDMFFGRPVEPELFFSPAGLSRSSSSATSGSARAALRAAPQRARQRPAREPRPAAGALRPHDHARSRALRDAPAPQRHGRAGAGFPRGLRPHRGIPVPLGHRHLGHQQPVPLLRADDRPRRRDRPAAGALRADDARGIAAPAWSGSPIAATSTCSASTTAARREMPEELRVRAVTDILERMFPVRAPWERDEVSAERESAPSAERSVASR